jgi:hypothetical protein
MYTVELYKADRRKKSGERLERKTDHTTHSREVLEEVYNTKYPASKGYRFEIHKTMVTKRSAMAPFKEFEERYDTPYYCSPSSETYWSM